MTILGGKYQFSEEASQELPNLGRVRTFTATGKRGAVYGCFLYSDGRFHWVNPKRPLSSVPFDLAQLSPLAFLGVK